MLSGLGRHRPEHVDLSLAGQVAVSEGDAQAAQPWLGCGELIVGGEQESGLLRP
jgi:hypothetical protein